MPLISKMRVFDTFSEISSIGTISGRVRGKRLAYNERRMEQFKSVKGDLLEDINRLKVDCESWYKEARSGGSTLNPPARFLGGKIAFMILKEAHVRALRSEGKDQAYVQDAMKLASLIHTIRTPLASDPSILTFMMSQEGEISPLDYYMSMRGISEQLWGLRRAATEGSNAQIKAVFGDLPVKPIDYVEGVGIRMANVAGQWYVRCGDEVVVADKVHLDSAFDMLKSFSMIPIGLSSLRLRRPVMETYEAILECIIENLSEKPNEAGEYLKAAKNLGVSSLDVYNMMGLPSSTMMAMTMDADKRAFAREFLKVVRSVVLDRMDVINVTTLYKSVIHPDAALEEAFERIDGLKHPNQPSEDAAVRFEGVLRKSLFLSMRSASKDPRLAQSSEIISNLVNKTQVDKNKLLRSDPLLWKDTKFAMNPKLRSIMEKELTPQDKSSCIGMEYSHEELLETLEWYKNKYTSDKPVPRPHQQIRPVNDRATSIEGRDNLDPRAAMQRFIKIVKQHERFEARVMAKNGYTEIEEITSEELEEFVVSYDPYLVLTEPKFGEYHKSVARLFYIAEQSVKALLQRVERVARSISRKQLGVSIVKSYEGKTSDLEMFADLMRQSTDEAYSLFIGFDMSEFSMKFPMKLVRIYGSVLAELTGYECLSRIDILFRNSIVIHDTRGFFGMKSGIKGGFEGFLNFVWTSIHAAVMDTALARMGREGRLLVYSDDGLLQLWIHGDLRESDPKVLTTLKKIQKIYLEHGLVFHLGKTLGAPMIWEYLGEVCLEGQMVPTWFKELASVGRYEARGSYTPFASMFNAIVGQCSAAVKAGAPPVPMHFIQVAECAILMGRKGYLTKGVAGAMQLICPTSLGGHRTRSVMEMAYESDIPVESYLLSELEELRKLHNDAVCGAIHELILRLKVGKQDGTGLASGSLFKTTFKDISGSSQAKKLAIKVREDFSLPRLDTPLKGAYGKELFMLHQTIKDLDRKVVGAIIKALPAVADYYREMALSSGASVHRLAGPKAIRRAQLSDHNNNVEARTFWRLIQEGSSQGSKRPVDLIRMAQKRCFRGLDLAPLRAAPVKIFRLTRELSETLVYVQNWGDGPYSGSRYAEAKTVFRSAYKSLAWDVEADPNSAASKSRKILGIISSLLAEGHDLVDFASHLLSMHGLELPPIGAATANSISRLRLTTSNRNDYQVNLPSRDLAHITVRLSGSLNYARLASGGRDRMVITNAAKIAFSTHLSSSGRHRKTYDDRIFSRQLEMIGDPNALCTTHKMTTLRYYRPLAQHPTQRLSESEQEDFSAALEETICLKSIRDSAYMKAALPIEVTLQYGVELSVIASKELAAWLVRVVRYTGLTGQTPGFLAPVTFLTYQPCLRGGFVEAAIRLMDPPVKSSAMLWCVTDRDELPEDVVESVLGTSRSLEQFLQTLPENLYTPASAARYLDAGFECSRALRSALVREIMGSHIKEKVVVACDSLYAQRHVSQGRAMTLKTMADSTVKLIYSIGYKSGWGSTDIYNLLGLAPGVNIDWVLDYLCIFKDLTRATSHSRHTHPANSKSLRIQTLKFYAFISDRCGIKIPGVEFKDDGAVTSESVQNICRTFGIKLEGRSGSDHRAMLEQPALRSTVMRIRFYLNNVDIAKNQMEQCFPSGNIQAEVIRMQTAFYELILRVTDDRLIEVSSTIISAAVETARSQVAPFEVVAKLPSTGCSAEILAEVPTEYVTLACAHASEIAGLTSYGKVNLRGAMPAEVSLTLMENQLMSDDKLATPLSLLTSYANKDAIGCSLMAVRAPDEANTAMFIMALSKSGRVSFSIIRERRSFLIIACAEDASEVKYDRYGVRPWNTSDMGEERLKALVGHNLIEDPALEALVLADKICINLVGQKSCRALSRQRIVAIPTPNEMILGASAYRSHLSTPIESSPLLAAASSIASSITYDTHGCLAYVLLHMHRQSVKRFDPDEVVRVTKELTTFLMTSTRTTAKYVALRDDIRGAITWLRSYPITTDEKHSSFILACAKLSAKLPPVYTSFCLTPCLPGIPVGPSQVIWEGETYALDPESLSNNTVSSCLYMMPAIAALTWVEGASLEEAFDQVDTSGFAVYEW